MAVNAVPNCSFSVHSNNSIDKRSRSKRTMRSDGRLSRRRVTRRLRVGFNGVRRNVCTELMRGINSHLC